MEIPGLSKFVKPSHNYLVPIPKGPDESEPEQAKEEHGTDETRRQLVDQFITATQNPPPGPGGILGISGPFDEPAPFETPEEYRARPHLGTIKPFRHVRNDIDTDIDRAKRRGDESFAQLREGDKDDNTQHALSGGNIKTWLILIGACTIWLLFLLLLIALPHGRDASVPNVHLY